MDAVAIRTRIFIGWLILSWQEFPETPDLLGSGVPPPAYISLQIILMLGVMLILCYGQWPIMPTADSSVIIQFVCGDGGSERE
jgi:hypothetical protein